MRARPTPKQAEPMFISDLLALCQLNNHKLRSSSTDPIHLHIFARDLAYFELHLFSGDFPPDLSHIKTLEILRLPNDKGVLCNHVFGKTLRSGDSRVLAVGRHPISSICPVKALDDNMALCHAIMIKLDHRLPKTCSRFQLYKWSGGKRTFSPAARHF